MLQWLKIPFPLTFTIILENIVSNYVSLELFDVLSNTFS